MRQCATMLPTLVSLVHYSTVCATLAKVDISIGTSTHEGRVIRRTTVTCSGKVRESEKEARADRLTDGRTGKWTGKCVADSSYNKKGQMELKSCDGGYVFPMKYPTLAVL